MNATSRLTTSQAAKAFGVTPMTLWLWRQGKTSKEALPHDVEMRGASPRVTFRLSKLRAWAKRNGVPFEVEPESVAGALPAKPGPVARVKRGPH